MSTASNWMFFRMRSTKAGLVGTALPEVSEAELIPRAPAARRTAALALVSGSGE
ncbi:hypothetical protein [Streptomyces sp. NPDC002666]